MSAKLWSKEDAKCIVQMLLALCNRSLCSTMSAGKGDYSPSAFLPSILLLLSHSLSYVAPRAARGCFKALNESGDEMKLGRLSRIRTIEGGVSSRRLYSSVTWLVGPMMQGGAPENRP
ncbi:hypothetical protein NDU88_006619 [Pleurodeles waltl]|uniref:Uncharacterized protein n=1 Tax=Pleurodeles waltl TaxID=8319 RepID=A0AAV7LRC3_PLEWA|nr:hypothetical protein NDU88_006619 [Pleurodeles waltl]